MWFLFSVVVSESELPQIAVEVLGADNMVNAYNASFYGSPKALDSVSMDNSPYILSFAMLNNTMEIWMNKTKDSKPMPMEHSFLGCLGNLMKITDSPQGHIFYGGHLPDKKGERHYSDKFAKLRDKLGLNPKLTLYKIRHTAISQVAKDHGLAIAQQMAGHKSMRTTLDNYYIPDTANVEKAQKDLLAKVMER